ncbi:MAG: hypothetical protein GWN31_04820, partial [Candidatus Thorarchaeota archaeon]|nr:hypothetical protein [Candidatus Thorarchaeota archaeon]
MTDDPAKVLLKKFYYRRVTRWGSKSYTEDKFLRDVLDERKNRERLTLISNRLGSNLGDSCILELGCGFGSMIITLKTLGIECYGIEPDGEILKVATLRIKTKGLENVVA